MSAELQHHGHHDLGVTRRRRIRRTMRGCAPDPRCSAHARLPREHNTFNARVRVPFEDRRERGTRQTVSCDSCRVRALRLVTVDLRLRRTAVGGQRGVKTRHLTIVCEFSCPIDRFRMTPDSSILFFRTCDCSNSSSSYIGRASSGKSMALLVARAELEAARYDSTTQP